MDNKYFVPFEIVDELEKIGYNSQADHCLNSFDDRKESLVPRPIYSQVFDWFDKKGIYFAIKPVINKGNLTYIFQMVEFRNNDGSWTWSWMDDRHFLTRLEANLAAVKKGIEILKYRIENDEQNPNY